MSPHEEHEGGGEESQSPIYPLESITTTDAIFRHHDCIEEHALSAPDTPALEIHTPPSRMCAGSPAASAADGQIDITSPVISQISRTTPSDPLNQEPRLSIYGSKKAEHGSKDSDVPHLQGINTSEDATTRQSCYNSAILMVDEVRKLSAADQKCPESPGKSPETYEVDSLQQGSPFGGTSDDAVTAVTTCALPPHKLSIELSLNPHQQIKSKQRMENLPRLNLLDIPLLGIIPPSQDPNAAPPVLEKIIQGSPPPNASKPPDDRDLQETCQLLKTQCASIDLSCQQPTPLTEPHLISTPVLNAKTTQVDEGPDDEVTFIVSVPKRHKKRKRTESWVAKGLAEEQAGKSYTATSNSISDPSLKHPTITTVRSSSVLQTLGKNVDTVSALPITDVGLSKSITTRQNPLPVNSSCMTPPANTQTSKSNTSNVTPLKETAKPHRWSDTACDLEGPAPIAAGKSKATEETSQIKQVKRKVDQEVRKECDSTGPIKRRKIQNECQSEGRSTTAAPTSQDKNGVWRHATMPDSPSVALSNIGLRSLNLGNANSQMHVAEPCTVSPSLSLNGNSYLVRPAPSSARNTSPQIPLTSHVSPHVPLWDLRRKPSLYSIPSWPSSPVPTSPPSNQQRRPTLGETSPAGISCKVTQISKSPPSAPGQAPISQRIVSDHCIPSYMTSLASHPHQSPAAISSQPYVVQRSLDHDNRPANHLPGQNIYAVSTWPAKPFLTLGQHPQSHPQRFAITPQEYARSLHSQYAQSAKYQDSSLRQEARCTTISPQMRTAELSHSPLASDPPLVTTESETLPSTNLLVDIAQTCQAVFPFARVAERHNQPVKRVFDAFSAVIQIPLLQRAADHRRNGKLGAARMKDFREALKAVNETHEKERKAEKQSSKMKNELAPPPAKKTKGKPKPAGGRGLLGKAIANSQRNASGST